MYHNDISVRISYQILLSLLLYRLSIVLKVFQTKPSSVFDSPAQFQYVSATLSFGFLILIASVLRFWKRFKFSRAEDYRSYCFLNARHIKSLQKAPYIYDTKKHNEVLPYPKEFHKRKTYCTADLFKGSQKYV